MYTQPNPPPRRVLIVSANPLFATGLRRMYETGAGQTSVVVGMPRTMEETFQAMESLRPDLVIVDYDDVTIDRAEFLSHFVASDRPMQVMLVSLGGSGEVVVYDRQTLTPSQAEERINMSWPGTQPPGKPTSPRMENMKHLVTAAFLVVVTTVLT